MTAAIRSNLCPVQARPPAAFIYETICPEAAAAAVNETAKAMSGEQWRLIYNISAVADGDNREGRQSAT